MKERLKELRNFLNLSQRDFSERINISQSTLAMLENDQRTLRDIHISQICNEFNVNEEWLRNGTGDMFIQNDTFTLDEYAKRNDLSPLELDVVKGYMELDKDVRKKLMSHFKTIFNKHTEAETETAATVEKDNDIEAELENYRLELIAEEKEKILSVSGKLEGKLG